MFGAGAESKETVMPGGAMNTPTPRSPSADSGGPVSTAGRGSQGKGRLRR